MATLDERFDAVAVDIDEGVSELLAEIQELKDMQGTLTPEQEAKLESIEAKAQAMADIIPNAEEGTTEG